DDLDGDSYEDILVASWSSYAEAISGFDGSSIWRYFCGDDVWAIYWTHDITGDGIIDVAAGSFTGSTYLIDGTSGTLIWQAPSEAKIFTVRPIKDVNGDGYDDVIAGQQMLGGVGGRFFVISGGTVDQTDIEEENIAVPDDYALLSNYPNPFNAQTTISFALPVPSNVKIEIYNITGSQVKTLVNEYRKAGRHTIIWDATDDYGNEVSTGVYFYRLMAGELNLSQKMTLIK
ncbi:MAG: T9SS type A sorting domain-containing protein, partial [Candidatus Zixiibacteriota bacterium]